jgi:hypothetical protein
VEVRSSHASPASYPHQVAKLILAAARVGACLASDVNAHHGGPGSVQGLHLVVVDLEAVRAELVGRSVDVGR